jgi:hypothetical protein
MSIDKALVMGEFQGKVNVDKEPMIRKLEGTFVYMQFIINKKVTASRFDPLII